MIERELLRLKEGGVCVVMVTHNIPQAHRLADTIVVLRRKGLAGRRPVCYVDAEGRMD